MRARRNALGFTLVELLVVIGVIAVLISLLLPAMNKTRAASRTVKCASQLRQLSIFVNLYAADYAGAMIFGGGTSATPMQSYADAFAYSRTWDGGLGYIGSINTGGYVDTVMPQMLICPSDNGNREYINAKIWQPRPQINRVSYGISGYSSTEDKNDYRRMSRLKPRQVVFFDKPSFLVSGVSSANQPASRTLLLRTYYSQSEIASWLRGADRHGYDSMNISRLDGSVDLVPYRELTRTKHNAGAWIR